MISILFNILTVYCNQSAALYQSYNENGNIINSSLNGQTGSGDFFGSLESMMFEPMGNYKSNPLAPDAEPKQMKSSGLAEKGKAEKKPKNESSSEDSSKEAQPVAPAPPKKKSESESSES